MYRAQRHVASQLVLYYFSAEVASKSVVFHGVSLVSELLDNLTLDL